jgi:diaminopimelate epimerase
MRFAKLHGLGNDFVLLDLRAEPRARPPAPERAVELCDRHRGIGADGVLTLMPGDRLVVHNPDGSQPEMCGNGARCAALWIATDGCTRPGSAEVRLETDAGARRCEVRADSASHGMVEIEMGVPQISAPRDLSGGHRCVPVSVGNPHRVIFTDTPRDRLRELAITEGARLSAEEGANVEFVARLGSGRYAAAVWERGAGLTQACGTGACAIAAAAQVRGELAAEIEVELPGGGLFIRRDAATGQLRMRGPAQLVYFGDLAI